MKDRYGTYIGILRGPLRVFVAIVFLMLLSRVLGGDHALRPARSKTVSVPEAHKERIAEGIAANYSMGNFKPSLEMKENADFMLTPALLVQEALCDDIVMTYPRE
jgi:hypothetical protein